MNARGFDIAIVGAGPAGSSSAISLVRKGYSVVLIDKAVFPREKLCGDFLSPINRPLLERLGVAEDVRRSEHEEVRAFRISTYSGEQTVTPLPSRNGQCFPGLGLRRFYLDHFLVNQAEKDGVVLYQGCKTTALTRERDGWTLTLDNDAKERSLFANVLLGADGRNSWVAHRLGVVKPGYDPASFVAFQLCLRGATAVKGQVQIHLFPGGYAGLVGVGGGMVNLCFSLEKKRAVRASSIKALLEKHLFRNPRLKATLDHATEVGKARSTYPVYFSPRRCYGDGFLLVGDAARVTEPVTGEGVYFALKSGELAAEAIHQAFSRGDFSARQLLSYHLACQKAFRTRQRVNRIIRALIYRPFLLTPLIRLTSLTSVPIGQFVNFVCQTEAPLQQ